MGRPKKVDQTAGDSSPAVVDDDYMRRPMESVNVDSLEGEHLKRYAKRAGIRQADIDGLTPDRLRQNIKLAIAYHFELLTE